MNVENPKQRGNQLGYQILILMYRFLGYDFLRFFLVFVVLYYYFTALDIKKITKKYYSNIGLTYSKILYFRHLYAFAISLLDRFASSIDGGSLNEEFVNSKSFEDNKKGSILIVSHFGSWGVAPNLFNYERPFTIVMKEAYKKDIKNIESRIEKDKNNTTSVIDLNEGFAALAKIAKVISDNEILGMMVDRIYDANSVVRAQFYGKQVKLNKNPFELAVKMDIPLYTLFVLGNKKAGFKSIFSDRLDGQTVEEFATSYAKNLENITKAYPHLWFNFYDFWETDK